jgi:hypothetical protein
MGKKKPEEEKGKRKRKRKRGRTKKKGSPSLEQYSLLGEETLRVDLIDWSWVKGQRLDMLFVVVLMSPDEKFGFQFI